MKFLMVIIMVYSSSCLNAQENILEDLLKSGNETLKQVYENSEKFEVQIIYTQINRDEQNFPSFTKYRFNVDPKRYFYPASTVKFPAAVLALEKINKLNIEGLSKETSFRTDSVFSGQKGISKNVKSKSGLPSIEECIKEILLVSDNESFNRLYEFLGQYKLNNSLHNKGYNDLKIIHRLSIALSEEQNRNTNPFIFYDDSGIIYEQSAEFNSVDFKLDLNNQFKGKGYLDWDNNLVNSPMDFSKKNFISLETLQDILISVMFPYAVDESKRFDLTLDDYNFLYKYMSMFPRECTSPSYDLYDSYVKFFMFGNSKEPMPKNIRIFNKVGDAYGFLIDNAYIVDFDNNIEFLLSAVIHVNENQIYNDGVYEYDKIGFPFLTELGKAVYNYELKRERKNTPNLSRFIIDYNNLD